MSTDLEIEKEITKSRAKRALDNETANIIKLKKNSDVLYAISDLFSEMHSRAAQLFKYDTSHCGIQNEAHYSYDQFMIDPVNDGYLVLMGTYYDSDDCERHKNVGVRFEDFFRDEFLDKKRDEFEAKQNENRKKSLERERLITEQRETQDRALYEELKERFEQR